MSDLRDLIQARLDNRDRERTEAAARERAEREDMAERVRRNARIADGNWQLEKISRRLRYARDAHGRAVVAVENLPMDSIARGFWEHEKSMRAAEIHSLEVAAELAVNDYPELADEFRALVQAVRS